MSVQIRPAGIADAEGMLEIYAPIVRKTAFSFELTPPSLTDFRERIAVYSRTAPWLVCEWDAAVAGYAYATPFRARPAYQWSVEVTVYVSAGFHRRGIARALYSALLEWLTLQGYVTAVGVIVLPNAASIALHESMGFERVGVFPCIGHKLGAWHDTGWWLKRIAAGSGPPDALKPNSHMESLVRTHGLFVRAESLIRR